MAMLDNVLTWSEATLAVLAVIGAIGVAIKSIYKMARNIETLLTTSEANAVRLQEIEKQVTLNGGSSLKDAVGRIEQQNVAIEKRISAIERVPCPMHSRTG